MQRIFIFLYALFACIFNMSPVTAVDLKNKHEDKTDLRILELLPNLLYPLAVNPDIPADFVALSPTEDTYDDVY